MERKRTQYDIVKGFIIGVLTQGDVLGTTLKDIALQNSISEKTYNVVKADMHKNNIIDSYQKDKQFYWTLKRKNNVKNDDNVFSLLSSAMQSLVNINNILIKNNEINRIDMINGIMTAQKDLEILLMIAKGESYEDN